MAAFLITAILHRTKRMQGPLSSGWIDPGRSTGRTALSWSGTNRLAGGRIHPLRSAATGVLRSPCLLLCDIVSHLPMYLKTCPAADRLSEFVPLFSGRDAPAPVSRARIRVREPGFATARN